MEKELVKKIGCFLGLIFNIYVNYIFIFIAYDILIYELDGTVATDNPYYEYFKISEYILSILFLIFIYLAWRWRDKPMRFLIWCYQKL